MVIVAGGIKGGSGKTTVATNLAVLRSRGGDILLVDADDQETASDFTQQRISLHGEAGYTCVRLSGSAVRSEVLKLRDKYDHVIIDTGGRDTTSQRAALAIADVLLIPVVPRSFDVWALEKAAELVDEMRAANSELKAWAFINRADPRGQDNGETAATIRQMAVLEYIAPMLGARKAFANAAAEGLSVEELKPADEQASAEMLALYQYVFNGGSR